MSIYGLTRRRGRQLVDSIPSTWRRYVLTGVVTGLTVLLLTRFLFGVGEGLFPASVPRFSRFSSR